MTQHLSPAECPNTWQKRYKIKHTEKQLTAFQKYEGLFFLRSQYK